MMSIQALFKKKKVQYLGQTESYSECNILLVKMAVLKTVKSSIDHV
jgi:hypothetical protein